MNIFVINVHRCNKYFAEVIFFQGYSSCCWDCFSIFPEEPMLSVLTSCSKC